MQVVIVENGHAWITEAQSTGEGLKRWVAEMEKHRISIYGTIEVYSPAPMTREDEAGLRYKAGPKKQRR